ncbi:MAG: glycosyltransferase family A protein [Candidatus Thorarchaeota archaeon]|jgi:hypothetical protein
MQQPPKVLLGINYYSGKDNARAKYLEKFLESIDARTSYNNYDVVIFDDLSPHPIPQNDNVPTKIELPEEPGVRWHIVRNRMFQYFLDHPEYDYLFAYDEDYVVVQSNWMVRLVQLMENIPEAGIIGSHWARLEDGVTRQQQHSPTGTLVGQDGFQVFTNKYVTGGSWTIRRSVIEIVGLFPEDGSVIYDQGHPGADTYYGWKMMEKTDYKLCTVETDLTMHTGQEFMRGKFKHKYNTPEFQAGKRLY